MIPDFSFQSECIERIWSAVHDRGVKRLVATAPTASGKSELIKALFERELARGGRPIVYTNRKTIRRQLSDRLTDNAIRHGLRAAGHMPDFDAAAQVSSIPTEAARSLSKFHPWELYDASLAMVDESHSNKADVAKTIMDHHTAHDCPVIGFTATPVGLADIYDELMILISNSELRKRGVIVPCDVFAPSELDMRGIDLSGDGDYVQSQVQERFAGVKHAVFGNVLDAYFQLNPTQRPTVLFPPGVPESRWFAEHLTASGVRTEHMDAETHENDRENIFARFRRGETKIVSSYNVLSEGWNMPEAEHMILCRPTASPTVYVQLCGRVLRASPGKERACLQDHVGAWWMPGLGSPNQDRHWKLSDTNKSIIKAEKQPRENRDKDEEKEPVRCPKCSRILACRPTHGYKCLCGHTFLKSVRMVIELNGTLERKVGPVTKRKQPKDDTYFYRSAIYAAARSNRTVGQAFGIACSMKKSLIVRAACQIWIPSKDDATWHKKASEVYAWALKGRTQHA